MSRDEALAVLDDLYAQLPALECKGMCHDSCTVIDASELERERLRQHGVDIGASPSHRRVLELIATGVEPRCPALGPLNTCRVYAVRPFICRAFGVAEGLLCEHGCVPDKIVPYGEVLRLLAEIEKLSKRTTGVSQRRPPTMRIGAL